VQDLLLKSLNVRTVQLCSAAKGRLRSLLTQAEEQTKENVDRAMENAAITSASFDDVMKATEK
jgi:hypothetical protein